MWASLSLTCQRHSCNHNSWRKTFVFDRLVLLTLMCRQTYHLMAFCSRSLGVILFKLLILCFTEIWCFRIFSPYPELFCMQILCINDCGVLPVHITKCSWRIHCSSLRSITPSFPYHGKHSKSLNSFYLVFKIWIWWQVKFLPGRLALMDEIVVTNPQ